MPQSKLLQKLVRVDLNLLTVLHALLEQGSTQAAAAEIGRTQSAVSHALKRLRMLFEDPLFVRQGANLVPTSLALQLRHPLTHLLHDLTSLVERGTNFDPASSNRQIVISTMDLALSHVMDISNALRKAAPNIRIKFTDPRHGMTRLLNGEVDLVIAFYRTDAPPGLALTQIKNLTWSTFVRPDHPISNEPTSQEWANFGHVQVDTGPVSRSPIDDAAVLAGVNRQVSLQVSSFLQAIHVVAQSDLLFNTMSALAAPLAKQLNLREIKLPLEVPSIPMSIATRATQHDPLSRWLSEQALSTLMGHVR